MSKFLDAMDDAEVDRLMRMPYAELVAEVHARGEDPEQIIREVTEIIQRAKAEAYRRQKFQ